MVPARCVKSEYMKRYKEPKWEACGPCYQELLRYRLSRRLLEQAHRPWFWDGWEQDSASGGSPSPPGTSSPPAAQQREEEAAAATAEVPGEPHPGRVDGVGETRGASLRGSVATASFWKPGFSRDTAQPLARKETDAFKPRTSKTGPSLLGMAESVFYA
ncbi:UNVERIFIED_CONTAM: hypothetical protein K2H54_059719 [Gekko kuhli]